VWFSQPGQLSQFMKQWKQRSSVQVNKTMQSSLAQYSRRMSLSDPIRQPRYYPFIIYSLGKLKGKPDYMPRNPVRAEWVDRDVDWPSAVLPGIICSGGQWDF
jgi:putative transposase